MYLFSAQSDKNNHHLTSFDAAEYRSRYRIRPKGAPQGSGASSAGEGSPVDGAPGAVRNGGHPEGASRGARFSFVPFFYAYKRKGLAANVQMQEKGFDMDKLRKLLLIYTAA